MVKSRSKMRSSLFGPCAIAMAAAIASVACGTSGESGARATHHDAGADAPPDAGDAGDAADADAAPPDAGVDAQADVAPAPYCGDGHVDPGEECDDGNANRFDGCLPDCTRVTPLGDPPLTWTYHQVPGTKCLDGKPAGFGVSMNPASTKLMIYLEGGGACFNAACDFTAFSIPFVPPADGIFSRTNPVNPVGTWNMIYVPYCSGDIHGGDNDAMLGGKLRYFHGYSNITTFLEQWVPSFPGVDTVLVTGISAGGFGAGLNVEQVADAFGPSRQYDLVDDSGPPLSNQVIPPCLQQIFRNEWGLDKTVLAACGADCPDQNDFARGWIAHVAKRYPKLRAGVFSNAWDSIIRTYMGAGWGNGQYNNCAGTSTIVPAQTYENDLLALRATYSTRISTYYVSGIGHTVLRLPAFWTTVVQGTPLPSWLGDVLNGQVTHVGP